MMRQALNRLFGCPNILGSSLGRAKNTMGFESILANQRILDSIQFVGAELIAVCSESCVDEGSSAGTPGLGFVLYYS